MEKLLIIYLFITTYQFTIFMIRKKFDIKKSLITLLSASLWPIILPIAVVDTIYRKLNTIYIKLNNK